MTQTFEKDSIFCNTTLVDLREEDDSHSKAVKFKKTPSLFPTQNIETNGVICNLFLVVCVHNPHIQQLTKNNIRK